MSRALCFWILVLLQLLILGVWGSWPVTGTNARAFGGSLLLFLAEVLLGWQVFGASLHG